MGYYRHTVHRLILTLMIKYMPKYVRAHMRTGKVTPLDDACSRGWILDSQYIEPYSFSFLINLIFVLKQMPR
jgi:hypothetical protein